MRPICLVALLAPLSTCAPVLAQAQTPANCAPRDVVTERLADRFGEARRMIGIASNNTVVETYASDETVSWSITVTLPNGLTCLVAAGEAFQARTDPLPVSDPDA